MKKLFQDKVAIITGGASGIGKTLGEELAKKGAQVVLADIQFDQAQTVAQNIRKIGQQADAVQVDVTSATSVQSLVQYTHHTYGQVDYMFNNAGIAISGAAHDFSLKDWEQIVQINIMGVVHGVQAVYPLMIQQGWGHIINTASIAGLIPSPILTAYSMSKHAVVGLSVSLRTEAAQFGVNISAVCPGMIKTPLLTGHKSINIPEPKRAKMVDFGGQAISPQHCVNAMLKGIAKNQALIVMPQWAKASWRLYRASPENYCRVTEKVARKLVGKSTVKK